MARTGIDLLDSIRALSESMTIEASRRNAAWQPNIERLSYVASATNLANYIAFRHHDLRELQLELMRHGLSSLGRLESRVTVNLKTVETALQILLRGTPAPSDWPPSSEAFFRGEMLLKESTRALLGESKDAQSGHIMVTLDSATAREPEYMSKLVERGADVVRINCAHDGVDDWAAMIAATRKAAEAVGRRIPVLMDIAGPKFRIGKVRRMAGERLVAGDRFRLVANASRFTSDAIMEAVCEPPEVLARLAVGTEVSLDDGKLSGVVESCREDNVVVLVQATQLKGFKLKRERGLTFPRADLRLDPLTAKDLLDLDFVARNADIVGFSFVQSADDISRLQDELAARRPDWRNLGIIAKIETTQAVTNLPDIIVRAAGKQPFGVMIARGDLAVAIGFERLAEMQEEILWLCEAAHVPVIWATQVLEEMVKSGLPTRGEMTDAAMATRAECVMLNKGPNVDLAITALRGLLRRMAQHQSKKTARLRALHSW